MQVDNIGLKDGKVDHEVLRDTWKIAYAATGTPSRRPGALSIEQMLWMLATVGQSVAHILVDIRENLDALLKQNRESDVQRQELFDQLNTCLQDFNQVMSAPPISELEAETH